MFNPKVIYQLNLNQLYKHVINEKRNVIYIGKAPHLCSECHIHLHIIFFNYLYKFFIFKI